VHSVSKGTSFETLFATTASLTPILVIELRGLELWAASAQPFENSPEEDSSSETEPFEVSSFVPPLFPPPLKREPSFEVLPNFLDETETVLESEVIESCSLTTSNMATVQGAPSRAEQLRTQLAEVNNQLAAASAAENLHGHDMDLDEPSGHGAQPGSPPKKQCTAEVRGATSSSSVHPENSTTTSSGVSKQDLAESNRQLLDGIGRHMGVLLTPVTAKLDSLEQKFNTLEERFNVFEAKGGPAPVLGFDRGTAFQERQGGASSSDRPRGNPAGVDPLWNRGADPWQQYAAVPGHGRDLQSKHAEQRYFREQAQDCFEARLVFIRGWSTFEKSAPLTRDEATALHAKILELCSPEFRSVMDLPMIYDSNFKIAVPLKSGGSVECRALQQHLVTVIRNEGLKVMGCNLTVGLEQPQHVRTRNVDLGRMAGCLREWAGSPHADKIKIGWGEASNITLSNAIMGRYNKNGVWIWLEKNLLKKLPGKTTSDVLDLRMCCGLDSE
jgi:hypothetical protein